MKQIYLDYKIHLGDTVKIHRPESYKTGEEEMNKVLQRVRRGETPPREYDTFTAVKKFNSISEAKSKYDYYAVQGKEIFGMVKGNS